MVSYKPLRDHMYFNDILITDLIEAGFNSRTTAKISKDEYISLDTIVKLCVHLDIPIEGVLKVIRE